MSIKFKSNDENKLFITLCEQYMQNLEYTIDATINDYTIEMYGEKELVQSSFDKLRQLAIEVSKFHRPDSNGMRPLGDLILSKVVKGMLEKKFLAQALILRGYNAIIDKSVLVTNASLTDVIQINNNLFLMLQGITKPINKDVRKYISLVLLEYPATEDEVMKFAVDNGFVTEDKRNGRFILHGQIETLLEITRKKFRPLGITFDEPEFSDLIFEGGKITFDDD